jgi:hypothetical protein
MPMSLKVISGDKFCSYALFMSMLKAFQIEYDVRYIYNDVRLKIQESEIVVDFTSYHLSVFSRHVKGYTYIEFTREPGPPNRHTKYVVQVHQKMTKAEIKTYLAKYNKLKAFT